MTSKQKRIIVALVLANTAVILALAVLVTHPFGAVPPLPAHPYTPTLPHSHAPILPLETCQWQATQLLAQAGLGGTVALTSDGSLRIETTCSPASGHTVDEAAQLVWTAFDVALALQRDECGSFTQVEVTILAVRLNAHDEAQGIQTDTRVNASVSAADLAAFGAGELSEDEFIERVTYTHTRVN